MRGDVVVADLQGSGSKGFRAEGCHAEKLGIVLNASEVMNRTGVRTIREAASKLLAIENADLVVVKDGPNGAILFSKDQPTKTIPAYSSRSLYKIGSGDIFTAVFAHHWMKGSPPEKAADLASRHTAAYVESPSLPLQHELPRQRTRKPKRIEQVIVVAEKDSTKDIWFVDIISEAISRLGPVQVHIVSQDELFQGATQVRPESVGTSLLWIAEGGTELDLFVATSSKFGVDSVFYIDDPSAQTPTARVFSDLSQAIYELFWEPL